MNGPFLSQDRYAEASQMEQAYAEAWASDEGHTLRYVTQQTRDGGKDFVGANNGRKVIGEVKHWERPVDRYVFSSYLEKANEEGADLVFGASNGLTEPAREMAEQNGVEILTNEDLSYPVHRRIFSILSETVAKSSDVIVNTVGWITSQIRTHVVDGLLKVAWKRWKRLPLKQKIIVGVAIIALAAAIYYGIKSREEENSGGFLQWFSNRTGLSG